MAPVKARAALRAGPRKKKPPPKPPLRLAAINRLGESFGGAKPKAAKLSSAAAGGVMFFGLAVAGAAWVGDGIIDVREAATDAADAAASHLGFEARIELMGDGAGRAEEVRAIALPKDRSSILSAQPLAIKARVEALPWVEKASVRRLWPNAVEIDIKRRPAVALWRVNNSAFVVDETGRAAAAGDAAKHSYLPLVEGAGAGPAAPPLLAALDARPALRNRIDRLIRVGGRRWDVKLIDGPIVSMPARDEARALERLDRLVRTTPLSGLARIDLRDPALIAFEPHAEPVAIAQPRA